MTIVYMEGTAQYARIFEGQEDTGSNLPEGSDQRNKLESVKGQFVISLFMDKEAKKKAIAEGIPDKGMVGQYWKEDKDGNIFYKCTRKNFNPKFTDKETGEPGVLMGPPTVVKQTDDGVAPWDRETDGEIGNGSKVVVKMNVWDGKISEMLAVKVVEHVEWIPEPQEGDF